jgi:hypothetical protein
MQKWSYFSMGIMAGIILVLLTVVVMQNHDSAAYGAPAPAQAVDNTGQGLMLATGGATSNQADILWVINKHKPTARAGAGSDAKDVVASKDERITICCYQVLTGGRKIKLVGVRDISFDMDLMELENDKPSVKEIVEALKKSMPKSEK